MPVGGAESLHLRQTYCHAGYNTIISPRLSSVQSCSGEGLHAGI